jgi:AP-3 complex subunit mu
MIQSFFLISNTGEVLIEKHWRGITSRAVCDFFWDEVNKYENKEEMPPVLATSKYYLISIHRDDIFLLVTSTGEIQPLLAIEFLHRVFDIFEEYFGTVEESTIKENFSTVYQLLEEMMDFGYPLTTEPNALKAMIKPVSVISRLTSSVTGTSSNVSDVLPDGTISNMPWRKTGVKYAQNEIYLDIIEEIDAIIDKHGFIISSEVSGSIAANSRLSGVPDLALTFANPGLIDDCSFHPCVRYSRFDRDKVVSFVPPDGPFELMKYRVNIAGNVAAPCYCQPQFSFEFSNNQGSVSIIVGQRQQSSLIFPGPKKAPLVVEDVVLVIPFSRSVRTANLSATVGSVLFDESSKVAKWTIGKLTSEKNPQLNGTVMLQPNSTLDEAPPIQMSWKVPMSSVSGLQVASLQLTNERYKPYKGVRTIAKSGKFQIRSS